MEMHQGTQKRIQRRVELLGRDEACLNLLFTSTTPFRLHRDHELVDEDGVDDAPQADARREVEGDEVERDGLLRDRGFCQGGVCFCVVSGHGRVLVVAHHGPRDVLRPSVARAHLEHCEKRKAESSVSDGVLVAEEVRGDDGGDGGGEEEDYERRRDGHQRVAQGLDDHLAGGEGAEGAAHVEDAHHAHDLEVLGVERRQEETAQLEQQCREQEPVGRVLHEGEPKHRGPVSEHVEDELKAEENQQNNVDDIEELS
mmetsp:Transcript_74327/g.198547  ORF Transcript_74327/g.198547 Transcript_74327/m.198547 type:complete len:256 (-) Transcript_74327:720-1487(-)